MRYSDAQTGVGVLCKASSEMNLGNLKGLYSVTDGAFSLILNVLFLENGENYFFGGAGAGSRVFYLSRNHSGTNNGSIRFTCVDVAGDERTVLWAANTPLNTWLTLKLVCSGTGDNSIQLSVKPNSTTASITSQTHDAGYTPETNFDLAFGEVNAGLIKPFITAGPITAYDRALTAAELLDIDQGQYPQDFLIQYPLTKPHIGIHTALAWPLNT